MYSINRRSFFGRCASPFYFFLFPPFNFLPLHPAFYTEKNARSLSRFRLLRVFCSMATFPRGLVALSVFPSNAPRLPLFRTFRSLHTRVISVRVTNYQRVLLHVVVATLSSSRFVEISSHENTAVGVALEHRLARGKINFLRSQSLFLLNALISTKFNFS